MARDSGPRPRSVRPDFLAPRAALDGFFASLARSPRRVLLLDYDGTLAPFERARGLAMPYPAVAPLLRRLIGTGSTRVGLVSGRAVRDLASRLQWLDPLPELWGSHGLERIAAGGGYSSPPAPPGLPSLLDRIERWARESGADALLERKPFGIALHRRPAPERFAGVRRALRERFGAEAREAGLVTTAFDGGVELRPRDGDKGQVVRSVLAEEGPAATVAYLGDDATDEDAFAALQGRGLAVLVRPRWRASGADLWIRPPEQLLEFLARWDRTAAGVPGAAAGTGP